MFVSQAHAQTQTPETPGATPAAPAVTGVEPGLPAEALEAGITHPEAEHGGGFPPFVPDFYASQILWLAITFGVFFFLLNKYIVPQIGGTLGNRSERIAADLDAATKMRTDADAAQAAYEQELAEARQRSQAIAAEARDATKASTEAERKRTEADLDARLDAAQARIGEIKARAMSEVGQIAEDVTQSILGEIAKLDVSREEVAGAVARSRT